MSGEGRGITGSLGNTLASRQVWTPPTPTPTVQPQGQICREMEFFCLAAI